MYTIKTIKPNKAGTYHYVLREPGQRTIIWTPYEDEASKFINKNAAKWFMDNIMLEEDKDKTKPVLIET